MINTISVNNNMNKLRNSNNFYQRKRSHPEKLLQQMYEDWYGRDRAMFEIESLQKPGKKIGDVIDDLLISLDKGDNVFITGDC